jgi:hypothetical protein
MNYNIVNAVNDPHFCFFFFLTCLYKGRGGEIRTCDFHFIRRDL